MGCIYIDREAAKLTNGSVSCTPSPTAVTPGLAPPPDLEGSAPHRTHPLGCKTIFPRVRCVPTVRRVRRCPVQGVGGRVRDRMERMATGELPHARPMLLFPEGTTTNGRFMLPFKSGAFLAGAPLQPVVLRYGQARGLWGCRASVAAQFA